MDDTYDFARHLRGVSFSLVAACVGLLLAAGLTHRSAYEQALSDLDGIELFQRMMVERVGDADLSRWIRAEAERIVDDDEGDIPDEPPAWVQIHDPASTPIFDQWAVIHDDDEVGTIALQPAEAIDVSIIVDRIASLYPDISLAETNAETDRFHMNSVDDFRRVWDAIDTTVNIYLPIGMSRSASVFRYWGPTATMRATRDPSTALHTHEGNDYLFEATADLELLSGLQGSAVAGNSSPIPVELIAIGPSNPTLDGLLRADTDGVVEEASPSYAMVVASFSQRADSHDSKPDLILVGYYSRTFRIAPLRDIRSIAQFRGRSGEFNEVFGDLVTTTSNISHLDFRSMRELLTKRLNDTEDDFQILGFNLPSDSVLAYGLILIMSIQGYFLTHLERFVPRLKNGSDAWKFAWLGVYPGFMAKLSLFVSIVALPVGVALVLAIAGLNGTEWWKRPLSIGGFYLCLALAASILARIWDIWDRRPLGINGAAL